MKLNTVVSGVEPDGKMQVALIKAIDRFELGDLGVEMEVDMDIVLAELLKALPQWEKHKAALLSQLQQWWADAQMADVTLDDLDLGEVTDEVVGSGKALKRGQWSTAFDDLGKVTWFGSERLCEALVPVTDGALRSHLEKLTKLPYDAPAYRKRMGTVDVPQDSIQLDQVAGVITDVVALRDQLVDLQLEGDLEFLEVNTRCVAVTVTQMKADPQLNEAKELRKISTKFNNDVRALCREYGISLSDIGSGFYCLLEYNRETFEHKVLEKFTEAQQAAVQSLVDDEFATFDTISEGLQDLIGSMSVSFEWAPMVACGYGLNDYYVARAIAFDELLKDRAIDVLTGIVDRLEEL